MSDELDHWYDPHCATCHCMRAQCTTAEDEKKDARIAALEAENEQLRGRIEYAIAEIQKCAGLLRDDLEEGDDDE
jgi:hypothetical protein